MTSPITWARSSTFNASWLGVSCLLFCFCLLFLMSFGDDVVNGGFDHLVCLVEGFLDLDGTGI